MKKQNIPVKIYLIKPKYKKTCINDKDKHLKLGQNEDNAVLTL